MQYDKDPATMKKVLNPWKTIKSKLSGLYDFLTTFDNDSMPEALCLKL